MNSIVDIVVPILIVCEYRIHSSLVTLVDQSTSVTYVLQTSERLGTEEMPF